MTNNTFINLKSVRLFLDRELSICLLIVGIFFCLASIFLIFTFNTLGIILGIILLVPSLFLTKLSFNLINKPALTLTEDCIYNFNKKIKLHYSDIYEVSVQETQKGKELFFKIKNIEKYSDKDVISFRLLNIDIDENELVTILNKKITNSNLNLIELFNNYEEEFKTNIVSFEIRIFNILLSLFILIYIGYSISINELVLASRNNVIYLKDIAMYIVALSAVLFIVRLLITVIQHYDQEGNLKYYEKYKIPLTSVSLILFVIGAFYIKYF